MRGRRPLRALAALASVALLAGCAAPIGVRTADPHDVQRYLTRSALTDDRPSDFSNIQLRIHGLQQTWADDPDLALAKLHEAALKADLPPQTLFALAELSFLRARKTNLQTGYAAAMIYSYALLFPEKGYEPLGELDPRERIAADLYNRALTSAFQRTKEGTLIVGSGGVFTLPFAQLTLTNPPDLLQLEGSELYDLQPIAELEFWGLRNRYRRPGIGAPLAAKMRSLPGVVPVVPVPDLVRIPMTAVVLIDSPLAGLRSGKLNARSILLPSLDANTIEINGHAVPLEAESTAALAATLADAKFWKRELQVFLGNAIGLRRDSSLFAIRPYEPGRIPVVFVHGTMSSPARWADMVNDLSADPRFLKRYSSWFFTYDSGNPIIYSGMQLRDALTQAVARADPGGRDPCVRDMVVMGHSQGGLLTKLAVIDSGNAFWANISDEPFDSVKLDPKTRELLTASLFVKPLPFVSEVIFLATPQLGSYLAGPQFVRRLAEYFVRLPSDLVRAGADVATLTPVRTGVPFRRPPTSIDNMSPGHPFIKALSGVPVAPKVIAHSIIAIDPEGPLDVAGDGVVKYMSAHVEGVDSELIVRSPHSGMQAAPGTIEEVRRILVGHSERSKCPMPKD